MKNERFKIVMGILLVPVLLGALMVFCRHEMDQALKNTPWDNDANEEDVDYDYDVLSAGTMQERGYVVYQQLPERIKNLIKVFGEPVMTGESREDSEVAEDWLEELGSTELLTNEEPEYDRSLGCDLEFDAKSCSFTPAAQVRLAKIEESGFDGFTGMMEDVTGIIRKNTEKYGENYWSEKMESIERYIVCCQDMQFEFERSGSGSFYLNIPIQSATCYVPEKYREFVQNVTADGEYFLYTTCVGDKIDVVSFCKNNSIAAVEGGVPDEDREKNNNKRIVCLFEDGKMVDYYVTTLGNELSLDEKDKKIVDTYMSGTGKELPDKPTMVSKYAGIHRIYRAS